MECKHSRAKAYALRASPALPRLRGPQPFHAGQIRFLAARTPRADARDEHRAWGAQQLSDVLVTRQKKGSNLRH